MLALTHGVRSWYETSKSMLPIARRSVSLMPFAYVLGLLAAPAPIGAAATPTEPSTLVALVVDSSGSLRPSDLEKARRLAQGLLDRLPKNSELAVFAFDDRVRLVLPRTREGDAVARTLRDIRPQGQFTLLNDALFDAVRYLDTQAAERKTIVLLTDGRDENSTLRLDDALKAAQQASIPIFAVGMGHADERLLRRVAKLTGGDYRTAQLVGGPGLAERIAALPSASPPPAAPAAPASPSPSPVPVASPSVPQPEPRRLSAWALVGVGAVLLLAVAVFAFRSRRREATSRCPTCGRDLVNPLSPCPACGAAPTSPESPTAETELSETVVDRMNITEEYLEKTVTLRDEPVLTITAGPGAGQVVSLSRQSATSIGRAKANDLVLEDVSVSSQHCRIRSENGKFILHDLKSTNGCFVNERRVTRHVLAEGDLIKIGETYLQFRTRQIKP